MHVEHREPFFAFRRIFKLSDEETRTEWTIKTDGTPLAREDGPALLTSTMVWDGDVLVFTTHTKAPQGEATNTVRYTLSKDGRTLIADESFRAPKMQYDNHWVFTKQ